MTFDEEEQDMFISNCKIKELLYEPTYSDSTAIDDRHTFDIYLVTPTGHVYNFDYIVTGSIFKKLSGNPNFRAKCRDRDCDTIIRKGDFITFSYRSEGRTISLEILYEDLVIIHLLED